MIDWHVGSTSVSGSEVIGGGAESERVKTHVRAHKYSQAHHLAPFLTA